MVRHWMFECKEITQLVSESMDRRLPLIQRIGIRFHLMMCHLCGRYQKQLFMLREIARCCDRPTEEPTTDCLMGATARARIKAVIQEQMDAEQENAEQSP